MAEKFEVKFQKQLEQMEQFVQENLEQATINMQKAEERRVNLQSELTNLQENLFVYRKEFFKVSKELAIMAIKGPKLPNYIRRTIQPIMDYIDCAERFFAVKGRISKAKNHEAEAKEKFEAAQADFEKISAIRRKDG